VRPSGENARLAVSDLLDWLKSMPKGSRFRVVLPPRELVGLPKES
jgi:hypothetical protein